MKHLPPDHALRLRLATRLKFLRQERALTQEQLALRLEMQLKAVQRLESGTHNPTIDTLGRIAQGLGVDVSALLDKSDQSSAGVLAGLTRAGWRVRQVRGRPSKAIPVVDVLAAAGRDPLMREGTVIAEALPPRDRQLRADGLFLVQVCGDSMQPQIRDGAWCLMRHPAEQPWVGRTILVCLPNSGGWLLKRVAAVEAPESGGWRVRLTARNPECAAVDLMLADASELVVAGELLEVVDYISEIS